MMELTIIDKHDYLAIGYSGSKGLCGVCFESVHGFLRFGIYDANKQIVNLYPQLSELFAMIISKYDTYAKHTDNKRIYRNYDDSLFYGLCATDETPTCGIHFMEDGEIFAGCSLNQNITGCYAYMSMRRKEILYGYFKESQLVKDATREDFIRVNISTESDFAQLFDLA